ncbi:MAG: FadR family transcriptional regulator [Pigmentiphaga sp.]|nr:FadR family transcriptional regulator [Pigmentiphaga sp.]
MSSQPHDSAPPRKPRSPGQGQAAASPGAVGSPDAPRRSSSAEAPALSWRSRGSLADEVAEQLRRRIINGEYAPGQRLPTGAALAAEFGVSMSVVREALSQLKHDGLMQSIQGAGAFVSPQGQPRSFRLDDLPVTPLGLARIFELRRAVEGEAAWLAALRRQPDHLAGLRQALEDMATAVADGTDGTEADARFHHLLAEATGNPLFLELSRFLSAHIGIAIETARLNSIRQGTWQLAHDEHRQLLLALEAGDAEAARTAVLAHIDGAAERLGLAVTRA